MYKSVGILGVGRLEVTIETSKILLSLLLSLLIITDIRLIDKWLSLKSDK